MDQSVIRGLTEALERLQVGEQNDLDTDLFLRALRNHQVVFNAGEDSVVIGGNAINPIIIIGDKNNVSYNLPGELFTRLKEDRILETKFQLPPRTYHHLTGRLDDLNLLVDTLREPNGKPVIQVVGLGGIGKTALAREALEHIASEKLYNNIVWTSAKSEHFVGEKIIDAQIAELTLNELITQIGRQCEIPDFDNLPDKQKISSIKQKLSEHRILVVVDNLEMIADSEQMIGKLSTILGKSRLLLTSRHELQHDSMVLRIGGFPENDGIEFILEESKQRNIRLVAEAQQQSLLTIYRITGGAPLAIKLVIGQMSRLPMDEVLSELRDAKIDGYDYPFYQFIFRHSWNTLDTKTKSVLVGMSLFTSEKGGTVEAIQTVSNVKGRIFHAALNSLVLLSLVDYVGSLESPRYSIHQLTNYFILSDIVKKWG